MNKICPLPFFHKTSWRKKILNHNQYCFYLSDTKLYINSLFLTQTELSDSVSHWFPFIHLCQLSSMTWVLFKHSCYVSCIFLAVLCSSLAVSFLTLFALLAAYIADCCATGRKVCCSSDRFPGQISDRGVCPSRCLSTLLCLWILYCSNKIITFYCSQYLSCEKIQWYMLFISINKSTHMCAHIHTHIATPLALANKHLL